MTIVLTKGEYLMLPLSQDNTKRKKKIMKTPKTITTLEAIQLVKSNDVIVIGMAGAEPKEFLKA